MRRRRMYETNGRLKRILKERGMTQRDLERLFGVSQASISRFDKSPRYESAHLIAIAHALNMTIDELFDAKRIEEDEEQLM